MPEEKQEKLRTTVYIKKESRVKMDYILNVKFRGERTFNKWMSDMIDEEVKKHGLHEISLEDLASAGEPVTA